MRYAPTIFNLQKRKDMGKVRKMPILCNKYLVLHKIVHFLCNKHWLLKKKLNARKKKKQP